MDNFYFKMVSVGDEALKAAMSLIFSSYGGNGASHYAIRPAEPAVKNSEYNHLNKPAKPQRMVFFWVDNKKDAIALPFKLDADGAADFARRWLAELDYGKQPDHDGDNEKGWTIYNESWGKVDEEYQSIIAISPSWAMYGK